jgi:hypothetical protein
LQTKSSFKSFGRGIKTTASRCVVSAAEKQKDNRSAEKTIQE